MTENINIQVQYQDNDGLQFAQNEYENKTVYGFDKLDLSDSEHIIMIY
jgi:hypothetical protein